MMMMMTMMITFLAPWIRRQAVTRSNKQNTIVAIATDEKLIMMLEMIKMIAMFTEKIIAGVAKPAKTHACPQNSQKSTDL